MMLGRNQTGGVESELSVNEIHQLQNSDWTLVRKQAGPSYSDSLE